MKREKIENHLYDIYGKLIINKASEGKIISKEERCKLEEVIESKEERTPIADDQVVKKLGC